MCQINLSRICLKKIMTNWLKTIKRLRISAFVIVHTPYCFPFKKSQSLRLPVFAGFIEMRLVRWINRWNEQGLNGLADVQQTGRPPILTLEEQAKSVEIAMRNPQFPHRQLSQIKAETGKEISSWTLKRVIKKRLFVEKN